MDETPMFFDMPGLRTVSVKGEKTVSVKTTGNEKNHFTVILACTADGNKLTPAVVFKRKTIPKDKFPKGIHVYVQEKGWVDEKVLSKWLKQVWFSRPGGLLKKPALLVWDMFRAHLTDTIKLKLKARNTRQAVITGGCTSVLQPLDVCLNKVKMREVWGEWKKETTKLGNLKRPGLGLVCTWIVQAWESIPLEMVMRTMNCLKSLFVERYLTTPQHHLWSNMRGDDMYDPALTKELCEQLFGNDSDE